jgi:hypothetical protein
MYQEATRPVGIPWLNMTTSTIQQLPKQPTSALTNQLSKLPTFSSTNFSTFLNPQRIFGYSTAFHYSFIP